MRYDISPLRIVIVQLNSSSLRLSSVLHSFIGHVAGITEASHRINLLVCTLRCKNYCSIQYSSLLSTCITTTTSLGFVQ
ncbi:unnamed protein product [Musa acuminata subsp. malaccensis]|uniref:(wild Malaysian banana) hypothetical protein n=1 Tax=Musa acuminata subsp. malaccensis TaxID=214687 RepID=A0A804J1M3_MUSAM|nr:unnamed protein product [Musa acuminata subsp. malaccensis]